MTLLPPERSRYVMFHFSKVYVKRGERVEGYIEKKGRELAALNVEVRLEEVV